MVSFGDCVLYLELERVLSLKFHPCDLGYLEEFMYSFYSLILKMIESYL